VFVLDAGLQTGDTSAFTLGVSSTKDSALAVRIPAQPAATDLAQALEGSLVGIELWSGAHPVRRAGEAQQAVQSWPPPAPIVVEGELPNLSKPATAVRLHHHSAARRRGSADSNPQWSVVRKGVYEERFILKQLTRNILFVCSGNTCRSPMAESIALDLIAKEHLDASVSARSAGVSAPGGEPMTPEARAALRELGVQPVTTNSKPLTRHSLAEADEVYVMTGAHRRAVLSIDPSAASRVRTLDPDGDDIPDPIGRTQEVYTHTAERMRDFIRTRLIQGS
jgi:protein-tyrosine phosphatase